MTEDLPDTTAHGLFLLWQMTLQNNLNSVVPTTTYLFAHIKISHLIF